MKAGTLQKRDCPEREVRMPAAVVIGGGLGGLATAIRLQHRGWRVTLCEKNETVGGRCDVLQQDGFTFDSGPTLLLMRDVLDDLFRSVGRDPAHYLDLIRVEPNYGVHFADGSVLTLSSNPDRVQEEIEGFSPGAGDAFRRYLADAGFKYRVSRDRFVERNFTSWWQFATPLNLYYLLATHTLRPLEKHARRYFSDPRLVAALTFQTMYLGLAPRDAPSVYSLLPYTEIQEGIWFPRGGMYSIVRALRSLAGELGVSVQTESEVTGLSTQNRLVTGVTLLDGRAVGADVVISNADLPYAYAHLIPPERRGTFTHRKLRRLNYGSSAFLMFLGLDCEYPQLSHHNVFLSHDVNRNFDAIFRDRRLPDDPSFYVCAACRTDHTLAPAGRDGLYVLVPVPHGGASIDWQRQGEEFKDIVYRRLEAVLGNDFRRHVLFERTLDPRGFASRYNILNGSAFGLSHNFRQVGYMRPANKARDFDNLYFVGAATVPGGGVPMVILGSRLTAQRVNEDWPHG
ncbi:MAG: phytoene desaturase family protein [Chloroflexota bacterium]